MTELPELLEHEKQVMTALGRLNIEWNQTEQRLRDLLSAFFPKETGKHYVVVNIVTMEMGTVGITQALKAISDLLDSGPKEAVDWIAEYFDRLRGYRNYYLHGITSTAPSSDLGSLGIIIMMSAKGELVRDKDFILIPQINEITQSAIALRTYINQLLSHLLWRVAQSTYPERPQLPAPPRMPEKLAKNRAYPLRPQPPPDTPAA